MNALFIKSEMNVKPMLKVVFAKQYKCHIILLLVSSRHRHEVGGQP